MTEDEFIEHIALKIKNKLENIELIIMTPIETYNEARVYRWGKILDAREPFLLTINNKITDEVLLDLNHTASTKEIYLCREEYPEHHKGK